MQNLNPDLAGSSGGGRLPSRRAAHSTAVSPPDTACKGRLECAKAAKLNVDTKSLSSYMRGKHRDIQDKVMDFFNKRPDLQTPVEILKHDHRELCMRQLTALVSEAGIKPFRYVVEDPAKYFVILEAVAASTCHLGLRWGCSTDAGNSLV